MCEVMVHGRMLSGPVDLYGFRLFRSFSTPPVLVMFMFGIVWEGVSPKAGSGSDVCLKKSDWNCLFRRVALARGCCIVPRVSLGRTTPVVSLSYVSPDCYYHCPKSLITYIYHWVYYFVPITFGIVCLHVQQTVVVTVLY